MIMITFDETKFKRKMATLKDDQNVIIEIQELTLPDNQWHTTWEMTEKLHNLKRIVELFE